MSAPDVASFHPLRALTLLIGAQTLFALLDATGKRLSHDMGIPLIALARHGGQAALMLLVRDRAWVRSAWSPVTSACKCGAGTMLLATRGERNARSAEPPDVLHAALL